MMLSLQNIQHWDAATLHNLSISLRATAAAWLFQRKTQTSLSCSKSAARTNLIVVWRQSSEPPVTSPAKYEIAVADKDSLFWSGRKEWFWANLSFWHWTMKVCPLWKSASSKILCRVSQGVAASRGFYLCLSSALLKPYNTVSFYLAMLWKYRTVRITSHHRYHPSESQR